MQPKQYDLIVVGAGVLGSFHAYHAAKKGWKVLLIEKDEKPADASVRNFGMIIPSGMASGEWKEHGRRSTEIYRSIQSSFDITLRANGSIYLASDKTETTLLEELAAINEKDGYACSLVSKEDCLLRYPGLRASYCQAGLFFPDVITVEPNRMVHHLIAYMKEQLKLVYKSNTLVKSVVYQADRALVETNMGELFTSNYVVICSGREFKTLYPKLFTNAGIELVKLQMMQTTPIPDYVLKGSIFGGLSIRRYESFRACASFDQLQAGETDSRFKKWGIHVLFKQAMDGSLIIGDSHEYAAIDQTDSLGFEYKQVIEDIILQEAQRMIRLPHWNIAKTWNGYYTQSKEQDIFRAYADKNILVLTAIGGKGMTASPAVAEQTINQWTN
jgi:FAD dependent oxidoreductase TIGR03364